MNFCTALHPLRGGGVLAEGVLTDEAALNALSPPMLREMKSALGAWRDDARVRLVLLRGAGRHFCAGGNIRAITQKMRAQEWEEVAAFFRDEYMLDAALYAYPKPVIGWGSGAVMGGGMGVLQGCGLRLLADGAKLAMPEVHIGLFPDVGAAWFLRRCPPPLGLFLGLCGATLSAQDALHANLAHYAMPADGCADFIAALQGEKWSGDRAQDEAQARQVAAARALPQDAAHSDLAAAAEEIVRCCGGDGGGGVGAAGIMRCLRGAEHPWLVAAVSRAAAASPAAMVHWQHHWGALAGATRAEVFAADYRAIMAFSRDPRSEFAEGVRALVIDKDKNPKWQHEGLDSVPADWLAVSEEDAAAAERLQEEIERMG